MQKGKLKNILIIILWETTKDILYNSLRSLNKAFFFMTKSFKEGNFSIETNVSALITISFLKMTAHGHFGQCW